MEHGLGRAHRQHEVGLDERAVHAQGRGARGAELEEARILGVVHLDSALEGPREAG